MTNTLRLAALAATILSGTAYAQTPAQQSNAQPTVMDKVRGATESVNFLRLTMMRLRPISG